MSRLTHRSSGLQTEFVERPHSGPVRVGVLPIF